MARCEAQGSIFDGSFEDNHCLHRIGLAVHVWGAGSSENLFARPRRKNIALPIRRPRTAAAPMAIPAIAPPDKLEDGIGVEEE
jgi:hypothetical protein